MIGPVAGRGSPASVEAAGTLPNPYCGYERERPGGRERASVVCLRVIIRSEEGWDMYVVRE